MLEYRLRLGRTVIGRADFCDVALPDDHVSRTHCFIDRNREGKVLIVDRSRHGTFLNGKRIKNAIIHDGDRVDVANFSFKLQLKPGPVPSTRSTPHPRNPVHEQILGGGPDGIETIQLSLRVLDGPLAGKATPIKLPDTTVGSGDSAVNLNLPGLVPQHFRLLVNQGRTIILPKNGAVTLDHRRIRGLFPLSPGETFTAGETSFQVVPYRKEEQPESTSFHEMIGVSKAMRRVFGLLHRMAAHPETVLLTGDSGTGKELAARGLHAYSARPDGPFVAINCGAVTESLFESELFGHEKGSFTGATSRRDGAFHQADGGTLFLDEVGEIPLSAQPKLLRALESGEVRRVGSDRPSFPDVRVIAATNRNLIADVERGTYREDLYFRLAVLTVRLPPLKERPEDIPVLAAKICSAFKPVPAQISDKAMKLLLAHTWPGNVRELRNVLTRAYVLGGHYIEPDTLSFTPVSLNTISRSPTPDPDVTSEEAERTLCRAALHRHGGNRAAAARELGLPRTTFIYKIRRLGLEQ